jgi:hypothetical protein
MSRSIIPLRRGATAAQVDSSLEDGKMGLLDALKVVSTFRGELQSCQDADSVRRLFEATRRAVIDAPKGLSFYTLADNYKCVKSLEAARDARLVQLQMRTEFELT